MVRKDEGQEALKVKAKGESLDHHDHSRMRTQPAVRLVSEAARSEAGEEVHEVAARSLVQLSYRLALKTFFHLGIRTLLHFSSPE